MAASGSETESFWDSEAGGYDAAHDRAEAIRNPLWIRMNVVLRLLGPRPGSVIDCGMGPGRLLVELAQRGWSVAGVDLSGEMVELARSRLPQSVDRLRHGSIESLPFPAESFDAAVATGVLEYVEDLPRALSEVARVLCPGGIFIVGAPNTRALRTIWRHRVVYAAVRAAKALVRFGKPVPLTRPGLVSPSRLRSLLAAAGFEVEQVEHLVLAPAALHALAPPLAPRLARRLGRNASLGALLGGQLVAAARKPGSPKPAEL